MSEKASKNDQSKLDLSLIPKVALEAEAVAFMVGQAKYGRYNYTKGHKASQLIAALLRHALAWNEGEECDPVDRQHHLGSVRACAAMILRQAELGTLIDDRFKGLEPKAEGTQMIRGTIIPTNTPNSGSITIDNNEVNYTGTIKIGYP